MSAPLCEGCGRLAGEREVFCAACGRVLPGRSGEPSDVTPPGWLVSAGAHGDGGLFEPMPSVPLVGLDPPAPRAAWPVATEQAEQAEEAAATVIPLAGPGWRVRQSPAEEVRRREAPPDDMAGEMVLAAVDGAFAAVPARPPLRALGVALLALVALSSLGAAALLVVHLLLGR